MRSRRLWSYCSLLPCAIGWSLPLRHEEITEKITFGGGRRFRGCLCELRRIFRVASPAIGLTQESLCLCVARIKAKRFLEFGNCFVHAAKGKFRLSQIQVGFGAVRIQSYGLLKSCQRFGRLARAIKRQP